MSKLRIEVDDDLIGRVWVNDEQIHDITDITLLGEPLKYHLTVKINKKDESGRLVVKDNMIVEETRTYRIGLKDDSQ